MTQTLVAYELAAGSADPVLRLRAHALRAVTALVPAALALFVVVTRRLDIEDAVALGADDAELIREWERHFAPAQVAASSAPVVTLRELGSAGGIDAITLYLRSAGTIAAAVGLVRDVDAEPFEPADALALRRIQPLLEHAYGSAVDPRAEAGLDALRSGGLTERETDVAELVARGATNAEIARSLNVSEATVKTHLTRIYTKLGVHSRTRLAILVGGRRTFG